MAKSAFSLEKIEVSQLPELQGLRAKQIQIVKDNPFIAITDNKTFDEAKKRRTNLVSARTEIQNQDKVIAAKIKKFRESVATASAELIAITKPHEDKQQEEVKRFEAEKEAERVRKQKLEEERISKIKSSIDSLINTALEKINNLSFEHIDTLRVDFEQNLYATDVEQFEEFEIEFYQSLKLVKTQFSTKEKQLTELEAQRAEAARIADEKAKLDKEKAEHAAKVKADNEKAAAEQKRIKDEQKAAQAKLDADRKALEEEKAKIAKEETDRKVKAEADRLAVEKAEAKRVQAENEEKTLAALKPEKERVINYLEYAKKVLSAIEKPEITNTDLQAACTECTDRITDSISDAISTITNFK